MRYVDCIELVFTLEALAGEPLSYGFYNYDKRNMSLFEADAIKTMRTKYFYQPCNELLHEPLTYLIRHKGHIYIPALVKGHRYAFIANFSMDVIREKYSELVDDLSRQDSNGQYNLCL